MGTVLKISAMHVPNIPISGSHLFRTPIDYHHTNDSAYSALLAFILLSLSSTLKCLKSCNVITWRSKWHVPLR